MDFSECDYLIVGAGIFGATTAERLATRGKKVLVIDRREHPAGNIYSYTDEETGIEVHKYGSHIFHTENETVWNYLSKFTEFNNYIHTVKTRHNGKLYPMPINLNTINLLFNTDFSAEKAEDFIRTKIVENNYPQNFKEKALSLVGPELYEAFLKGYTEKQWHKKATELPAELLSRIPVRFSDNDRYFASAKFQGIPKNGYTKMILSMLKNTNITLKLGTDFNDFKHHINPKMKIIYTGQVDELMDYQLGTLPWRSLRFEEEKTENSLGQAVINEADAEIPYTRTHDYKYYQIHQPEIIAGKTSIVAREYPVDFARGREAYYPINNPDSEKLYQKYIALAKEKYPNLLLGGRLGAYRYWDMDIAVKNALALSEKL